ncbi:hypothetical protein [Chryseobacterium sp. RR2-3-20]|uniref:hypothetical protein n=1 Tax=Chryseobacterium sp. RR2-3-20 TaxID=2787626 RepID=UPI001AE03D6F|nr:hypothetical protein [Chryseobacterium sp. RR2-3-20]
MNENLKKTIVSLLVLIINILYSQDANQSRVNSTLNAKFGVGYSDFSINNIGRFNMNSISGIVSYNKSLGSFISLETGVGFINNSGNLLNQTHVNNVNLVLPVSLKVNVIGKSANTFYSGVGIMPTYKISSKIDNDVDFDASYSNLINDKGGNFLIGVKLGTEIAVSDKANMSIEFSYYADTFQYGYSNKQKLNNYAAISVGLVRF